MEPTNNKIFNWKTGFFLLFLVAIIFASYLGLSNAYLQNKLSNARHITDTVYVDKPYKVEVIKKEYVEIPVKVTVYKRDTVFRDLMEKSDIITGVHYTSGGLFSKPKLVLDKISPKGFVFSNEYNAPKELKNLTIDYKGNLTTKPNIEFKVLKVGGITVVISAAALGGYKLYKKLKK